MKREADADMGSPQKRSRRGDEEVRLLIPSKVAGCIIGKGGQNITKLRSQYKASITVPDCPGPERLLTLSSDLETICNIINDVIPNLEENNIKSYVGGELDLRMMIHQSQAGCIIGKSGQKIKELRESTGARIKIFTNPAPRSTDRVIQIIGDSSKCIQTIREVLTLIKGSPVRGIVNAYDPHNYDEYYADEYGGWGSVGGNSRRDGGMDRNNRNSSFKEPATSGPPGRFNNSSRGGGGGGGRNMTNYNDRPSSGGGGGMTGRSLFGGGNRMNGDSYDQNVWNGPPPHDTGYSQPPPMLNSVPSPLVNKAGPGGKDTTQVTIPKDLAGAIIGKGGGRIRKIRQDSGAGITIDEPLPGSTDRIITISGLPNQIQMAQYLLQQSVHNNADRNTY